MSKIVQDTWVRRPSLPTIVLITIATVILRVRFSDIYTELFPASTEGPSLTSRSVPKRASRFKSKSSEQKDNNASPTVKCVIYDRPMRTASTTITASLNSCFSSLGWTIDRHHLGNNRSRCIEFELQKGRPPYAMIKGHKWLTAEGVHLLRATCTHLIYITSTAPLWEQVWSAAKMLSNVRTNGNSTLDSNQLEAALSWIELYGREYARLYEAYPHIRLTKPLEIQPDGRYPDLPPSFEREQISPEFVPDYVIRKPNLLQDLPPLLKSFGCESTIGEAKNVHSIRLDSGDIENDSIYAKRVQQLIGASDGNRYSHLTKLAELNNEGVSRIRKVMQI